MATRPRVKTLMDEELTDRAPDRREEAGNTWNRQPMGFFFPRNEDTTDLCALAVLSRALKEDGMRVSDTVKRRVRELINTPTIVDDAITIIFLATAQPVRASARPVRARR